MMTGVSIADSWRCPNAPGSFFNDRESAAFNCGERAYFTIAVDSTPEHQARLNIGGHPREIYTQQGLHTQQAYVNYQATAPVTNRSPMDMLPYTGNFPYAAGSSYGDFSAGAGFGDW